MIKRPNNFLLLISIIVCELVGILATPFTISSIPTWYAMLNKPPFSPPNWIFGPVWTLLYFLMGIALYLIWVNGINKQKIKTAIVFFVIQLLLNFLWSVIFFGFHQPVLALIEIIILWFAIFMTMMKFLPISRSAGYLLLPYFLWVSFAALLNLSIVMLN